MVNGQEKSYAPVGEHPSDISSLEDLGYAPILRIRAVTKEDVTALSECYSHLDTCNGSAKTAENDIESSLRSFRGHGEIHRLTFAVDTLNRDNQKPERMIATGSLIKLDQANPPQVYREVTDGLGLYPRRDSGVEHAAMVVLPEFEGLSVGKSMTFFRALIARRFRNILGTTALAEFLPDYEDYDKKLNAFWQDLILPAIVRNGCREKLTDACSTTLGREVTTDDQILMALVKDLDGATRNRLVAENFPKRIPTQQISPAARSVTSSLHPKTLGAVINLGQAYGPAWQRSSYFPVDGGPNYTAEIALGATGEYTSEAVVATNRAWDQEIMRQTPELAIVCKPFADTRTALSAITAYVVPGIFRPGIAKISSEAGSLLRIKSEDELTFHKLPGSSGRRSNQ